MSTPSAGSRAGGDPHRPSVRSLLHTGKTALLDHLAEVAPTLAAYIDWCQPGQNRWYLGPMNRQPARQELVRAIARSVRPQAVIETGTHRGATTHFLWAVTGAPTWTVEVVPRFAAFAEWRLGEIQEITVRRGESRAVLRQLAADPAVPKENVFFYLDAHWGSDLPLREELMIISEAWRDPVIMIDDFEVPDDPGYRFDDYGDGNRLTVEYLRQAELGPVELLFPACPSSAESGLRRGCVVIASPTRADTFQLEGVPVRRYGSLSSM